MPPTLPPPSAADAAAHAEAQRDRREARNLLVLALHQIAHRVAWIFKTESVIMPFFLDRIAPPGAVQGLLRGCLPVLNRVGQGVLPLLYVETLRRRRRKSRAFSVTSALMAVPFAALSLLWLALDHAAAHPAWLPAVFLAAYGAFFVVTGLNQLTYGVVQAKLIRPARRGRLLALAGLGGTSLSIPVAVLFLAPWLSESDGGFAKIFAITAAGFVAAALCALGLREEPDVSQPSSARRDRHLTVAWRLLRSDPNFRRLTLAGSLFMGALILFPHYQALGRGKLTATPSDLMLWVVVQNVAVGLFSLAFGTLADRRGYRAVVSCEMLLAAATPVVAVILSYAMAGASASILCATFFLIGLTPVTVKSLDNFVLEIAPAGEHARYLGTFKLCTAAPFVLSPLVGLLVELAGFAPVFIGIASLIALGGLITLRVRDPRVSE